MRIHGTLTKWNDERGFGFVTLPQTHDEVFVHISAFPRDGVRPRIGETVSFEVRNGPDGRKRAEAVERPSHRKSSTQRRVAPSNYKGSLRASVLMIAVVSAIGLVGYNSYISRHEVGVTPSVIPAVGASGQSFTCDRRTHCSQMTSCEEAKYFLNHCPGSQMDGDGDGEPCEQQWCN
jgi:cold shock CspA family protein